MNRAFEQLAAAAIGAGTGQVLLAGVAKLLRVRRAIGVVQRFAQLAIVGAQRAYLVRRTRFTALATGQRGRQSHAGEDEQVPAFEGSFHWVHLLFAFR